MPAVAAAAVHVRTGVGPVLNGEQVVDVKLFPELAPDAVQLATGTLVVTMGAGQVVVV